MSDVAALLAQLANRTDAAPDPALAAVRLARASIDALVLKLGQTVEATVTAQLAGGLTQLSAANESFALKLATPLPVNTSVTINVTTSPGGQPAVTVTQQPSVPAPASAPAMPQSSVTTPLPPPPEVIPAPSPQAAATPSPAQPASSQPQQPAEAWAPASIAAAPATTVAPTPAPVSSAPPAAEALAPQPAPTFQATPAPTQAVSPRSAAAPTAQPATSALSAPTVSAAPLRPTAPPPQPTVSSPAPAVVLAPQPEIVPTTAPTIAPTAAPAIPLQPAAVIPAPAQPTASPPLPVSASAATQAQIPVPATVPVPQVAVTPAPPSPQPLPPQPMASPQPTPVVASPSAVSAPTPAPQPVPTTLAYQSAPSSPAPAAPPPQAASQPVPAAPRTASPIIPSPPLAQILADPVQTAARQDTAAPLMAKAAAIIANPAIASALPRAVLEAIVRALAGRIDLNRTPLDGRALREAVLQSGTLQPLPGQPATSRDALLALRSALSRFLGGEVAAIAPVGHRPPPPLKGEPARAPQPTLPPVDDAPDEAARELLGHTDATLSRTKLLQAASTPDPRPSATTPAPEFRFEIPMLLGAQTGILQLMVERDGRNKPNPRERGWRMRFALNFSATGEVGADIALLGRAANIALWAAEPATAGALEALLPELVPALASHGLDIAGLRVRRGAPPRRAHLPGQLLDSAR